MNEDIAAFWKVYDWKVFNYFREILIILRKITIVKFCNFKNKRSWVNVKLWISKIVNAKSNELLKPKLFEYLINLSFLLCLIQHLNHKQASFIKIGMIEKQGKYIFIITQYLCYTLYEGTQLNWMSSERQYKSCH